MGPVNASDSKDPALPARVILYSRIKKNMSHFNLFIFFQKKKSYFLGQAGQSFVSIPRILRLFFGKFFVSVPHPAY